MEQIRDRDTISATAIAYAQSGGTCAWPPCANGYQALNRIYCPSPRRLLGDQRSRENTSMSQRLFTCRTMGVPAVEVMLNTRRVSG
jgi:Tfp pilus assembly ATPase PilU